jgi:hypothetical protein
LTLADGVSTSGGCIQNIGKLTISGCVLSNNIKSGLYGAAVENDGLVTISNSIVCSNRTTGAGGGLLLFAGIATLVNSTFYGNAASQGGGLHNEGMAMYVTNCTFFANSASGGGAIYNASQLFLRNCTIVSNSATAGFGNNNGGGIQNEGPGAFANVGSTIIAGNTTATNTGPDCFGSNFVSAGYNFIGRTNGSSIWNGLGDQVGTILSPLDSQLGAFQNNEGPTPTLAPLVGSPVIDQGKTTQTRDQRGLLRPAQFASIPDAIGGDGTDIGAVEFWPANPSLNIRKAGPNILVAWPASGVDFRLQSATNLPASNTWSVVTNPAVIVAGQLTVTNGAVGNRSYYRLIFP